MFTKILYTLGLIMFVVSFFALIYCGAHYWSSQEPIYTVSCFSQDGKLLFSKTSRYHPAAYRDHRHTCLITSEIAE